MKPRQFSFILFLVIVILEFALFFYLVQGRRMVLGHDGFELFSHQYYFLNSKVVYGQIPLWTPYMTQGTPTWWYFTYSRIDMFTNMLMLFSKWIRNINFLPLFYGGLFFNKFILLTGVWLLAKRYFTNPVTKFFVASTVMASTIALNQSSFTLSLFYGLPLIIYLLHCFFDALNWKWLFCVIFLLYYLYQYLLFCLCYVPGYFFIFFRIFYGLISQIRYGI